MLLGSFNEAATLINEQWIQSEAENGSRSESDTKKKARGVFIADAVGVSYRSYPGSSGASPRVDCFWLGGSDQSESPA